MKLLVQSDDYGFTKGIVDGMCDAFENGIITSVGLFANMPCREYAVKRIKDYPHICFGIDINVVSGPSVADPKLLPTLVNPETNMFYRTSERIRDPRWGQDVFKPYDEVFIEGCAQVEKFIELVGKKPEYLTSHSTGGSQTYLDAIKDVAARYDIPFSKAKYKEYGLEMLKEDVEIKGDMFSYENQARDRVESVLAALEKNKDKEYVLLGSHCGYVDGELIGLTRMNLERAMDHRMLTSEKIKKWIKDNGVELISFRDL